MNRIDERKQAFENKFVHDAEMEFKINARAHKLIGVWAATQMNKDQQSIDSYAAKLVEDTVDHNYDDDQLVTKISNDFIAAGINYEINEIKLVVTRIKKEAEDYIKNLKI